MSTQQLTGKVSQVLPGIIAVIPILSLIVCFVVLSAPGADAGDVTSAAAPKGANEQSASLFSLFILLFPLALILGKLLAVFGNFVRWYYAWVFHMMEMNLVIFIAGLLVITSVFTAEWSILGFLKILTIFLCLGLNFYLKSLWGSRGVRDQYQVTHYTHA